MTVTQFQELESVFGSMGISRFDDWTDDDIYRAGFCRALAALGIEFSVFDKGFPRKLKIKQLHNKEN